MFRPSNSPNRQLMTYDLWLSQKSKNGEARKRQAMTAGAGAWCGDPRGSDNTVSWQEIKPIIITTLQLLLERQTHTHLLSISMLSFCARWTAVPIAWLRAAGAHLWFAEVCCCDSGWIWSWVFEQQCVRLISWKIVGKNKHKLAIVWSRD